MSVKSIFWYSAVASLGLLATSCEKVIEVDLNSADPKTVIEANLQEGDHLFQVRVYQTKAYFSDAPTTNFDDATVVLSDGSGETVQLAPTGNGRYAAQVLAEAGKTYTLQVSRAGETFTATSTLPPATTIASLSDKEINLPGEGNNREVYVQFDDQPGERNFYRILVAVNDSLEQDLQYFDDKYIDGNDVKWALNNLYQTGDQLDVELRSIDEGAYQFYNTLAPILSGNVDTAPGNPTTNWNGGALGYFVAYSSSRKSLVVE